MTHGHTYVAQNGRVGKVALQAADGQLLCQVRQDGICHAKIALGILEVDGVHLVGHSAGTNFASLHLLTEILHGDVLPEVAVQIDDDGVDALHGIEHACQAVVVGNLCGPLLTLQAQLLTDETVAECTPVILGICHIVGVVVAGGATELGGHGLCLQCCQLALQTVHKHHHLLAHTGGRCRLAVGLGKHGNVLPLLGIGTQLCYQLLYLGIVNLLQSLLDAEGHTGIVDILTGETEMDELLVGIQTANLVELFLDEILHGLYVVVSNALYVLHALGISLGEVAVNVAQSLCRCGKTLQLGQRQFAQSDEILNLYSYAVLNKCVLRKITGQRLGLATVTSINRTDC